MNDFKFDKKQKVRLKYDVAHLYQRAFGGSEGIISARKRDDVGFPMVLVEWDKDHWTYNGESDMWTFEDHFEAITEEPMATPDESNEDLRQALINFLQSWPAQSEADEQSGEETLPDPVALDSGYASTVESAFASAVEGEAVMVITVKRQNTDPSQSDAFVLVPDIYSFYKTEEAGILLETQVSQVAAMSHQDMAGHILSNLMRRRGDEDDAS